MEFIIHNMCMEDMDGKGYVHWKSWQDTYQGLVDQNYLDNLTLDKCVEMARLWPNNILVAKEEDKVIGFTAYGKYRDGDLADCGEIMAIYVLKEYHNQKIGYALMNAAFEKLKEHPQVVVWVLRGNDPAIKFYERYGFQFDGVSKEIMVGTPNVELRMIYKR